MSEQEFSQPGSLRIRVTNLIVVRVCLTSLLLHGVLFGSLSVVQGQSSVVAEPVRRSLDGPWQARAGVDDAWQAVTLPAPFEALMDIDFDGVMEFQREFEVAEREPGERVFIRFHGVATHAQVLLDDHVLGEHLGGWTPFDFDITSRLDNRSGPHVLKVIVDERVGHNTQGFLPIIAPHFGGIWQSVELLRVTKDTRWHPTSPNGLRVDSFKINPSSEASAASATLSLSMPSEWNPSGMSIQFSRGDTTVGEGVAVDEPAFSIVGGRARVVGTWQLEGSPEALLWSPHNPGVVTARFHITLDGANDETRRTIVVDHPVPMRSFEVAGHGFQLNGKPVVLRGLLNWGYAPPRTAPTLNEAAMRHEIEFAQARGFNLMKFCLWVPPKRYLELCDELGMMVWMEYPAWHPDFSAGKLDELRAEYREFFEYDRVHPCVVLRSLTCETGSSADLDVIQALYDECKLMIPGAVVVDDSSWIEWNRVYDFFDDHPYGNNHTWVETLASLKAYIADREPKPLMLGEAITADTWTDPSDFATAPNAEDRTRWHEPASLDAARQWLIQAELRYGAEAVRRLEVDSKRYAMLMRKFQMETFRREVPEGGYVVSVIRDFAKAPMGLLDFHGRPKWTESDWSWHGDMMMWLETDDDRRSFFSGDSGSMGVAYWKNDESGTTPQTELVARLFGFESEELAYYDGFPLDRKVTQDGSGNTKHRGDFGFHTEVAEPTRYELKAILKAEGSTVTENAWPLWVFPTKSDDWCAIAIHDSAIELTETLERCGAKIVADSKVLVTRIVDQAILDALGEGRSVVLLADGRDGSFATEPYWFLRGGPIVSDTFVQEIGSGDSSTLRDMLVELQHFDLAADVIRDVDYLDAIDPWFMLWETHDLSEVKNNGLLFRMPVGQRGNLVVSALNHDGETNAAGSWLLGQLLRIAGDSQHALLEPDASRGAANLARLTNEVHDRRLALESLNWQFQPDAEEVGADQAWFRPDFDDSEWGIIKPDRHWEGQGYDTLDGWAWYRLTIEIPEDWSSEGTWLNFTGVDDYYDVYVDGHKVGSGGDIASRTTAFDLRSSHEITPHVVPGESVQISVAVYDWYGAGGIFRPFHLSTRPTVDGRRWLK